LDDPTARIEEVGMSAERGKRPAFDRGVKAKIAANVIITSALAVLLAVFVNYGVHRLSRTKTLRHDLTREGTYTLDATTLKMVDDLDDDVRVYALLADFDSRILEAARKNLGANTPDSGLVTRFYRPALAAMSGRLRALFGEASRRNARLQLEIVDARKDRDTPARWRRELGLDPSQLVNHLVFFNPRTGKKRSFDLFRVFDFKLGGPSAAGHIPPQLRGDFIDAYMVAGIKATTQFEPKKVGIAVGHGEELRPAMLSVLEAEGFQIEQIDLGALDLVPNDIDLVAALSPSRPWRPEAREALRAFAERGGAILLTQGRSSREPFQDLLGSFGVEPQSLQVGHPTEHARGRGPFELRGAGLLMPSPGRAPHPVTELLVSDLLPVHLGFSRSFRIMEDARDGTREVETLLRSGEEGQAVAWVYGRGGWRQAPERESIRGRDLVLATAMRRALDLDGRNDEAAEARIICFGSDEWLNQERFNEGFNLANRDLFTSSIYWLVGREKLITRAPRVYTRHIARLEEDDMKTFSALTIWILPALSLLAGLLVFFVRRRS
jgi:ABC transporter family protein